MSSSPWEKALAFGVCQLTCTVTGSCMECRSASAVPAPWEIWSLYRVSWRRCTNTRRVCLCPTMARGRVQYRYQHYTSTSPQYDAWNAVVSLVLRGENISPIPRAEFYLWLHNSTPTHFHHRERQPSAQEQPTSHHI